MGHGRSPLALGVSQRFVYRELTEREIIVMVMSCVRYNRVESAVAEVDARRWL